MANKTKKTLSVVLNVVVTVFLVFAVAVTIYATVLATSEGRPSVGNKYFLTIQSGSMEGEFDENHKGFDTGSLIVVTKLTDEQKKNLKIHDVITYEGLVDGKEGLITHRITQILTEPDGKKAIYGTKGDYLKTDDKYDYANRISEDDILAIWQSDDFNGEPLAGTEIKGLGAFLTFMTSQIGFLLIIVLPLAGFFVLEVINLVKVVKQANGKKTITAKDEDEIKRKAIEEFLKNQQAENSAKETSAEKPSEEIKTEDSETK